MAQILSFENAIRPTFPSGIAPDRIPRNSGPQFLHPVQKLLIRTETGIKAA